MAREEHAGRKVYRRYRNALQTDDHIEVDVNVLHRVTLVPPVVREAWTPDPDQPCRTLVVGTEETVAGKVLAADRPRRTTGSLRHGVRSGWSSRPRHRPLCQGSAARFRVLFIAMSGVMDRPVTT